MSNHLHVVVQFVPEAAAKWSADEVATRWLRLYRRQDQDAAKGTEALAGNVERIEVLRQRLSDLSWFMRCLAEPIARRASREDSCKGHYVHGRTVCRFCRSKNRPGRRGLSVRHCWTTTQFCRQWLTTHTNVLVPRAQDAHERLPRQARRRQRPAARRAGSHGVHRGSVATPQIEDTHDGRAPLLKPVRLTSYRMPERGWRAVKGDRTVIWPIVASRPISIFRTIIQM